MESATQPSDDSKKPRRRNWPLRIGVVSALAVLFVLDCSGLLFPILTPKSTLAGHFQSVLGLPLPASMNIVHATRIATNDPGHYFAFELSIQDRDGLIAQLESRLQPKQSAERVDPTAAWTMGPKPDWWTPTTMPSVERIDVQLAQPQSGVTIYYSRSSPVIYFFWFET